MRPFAVCPDVLLCSFASFITKTDRCVSGLVGNIQQLSIFLVKIPSCWSCLLFSINDTHKRALAWNNALLEYSWSCVHEPYQDPPHPNPSLCEPFIPFSCYIRPMNTHDQPYYLSFSLSCTVDISCIRCVSVCALHLGLFLALLLSCWRHIVSHSFA